MGIVDLFTRWMPGKPPTTPPVAADTAAGTNIYTINTESVPEDAPSWKRKYTAQLTGEVSIRVEYRSWGSSSQYRSCAGELQQKTGSRWILFDPKAIADKIIDPNLVPLVEQCCKLTQALDDQFMAAKRCEFTDEHGDVWRKATEAAKC